jgi:molybdenum cofactor cytidylyltransferase
MISCIVLAAGLSSRFGSLKALASLSSKTNVIQHVQKTLIASQVSEIIIVLGFQSDHIKEQLRSTIKTQIVLNKDFEKGQTSSFKRGLSAVSAKSEGIMLLPVDYPFVREKTFNDLINSSKKSSDIRALIPTFSTRKGHPPIFDISLKSYFEKLDDSLGINSIFTFLQQSQIEYLPVSDPGVVATFNTPDELRELTKKIILD